MSHHPQDHFDAGSIAFASNADCDRATVLFSQLANALQSEQLKNREAADAIDAQAERIKALEGDVTNRQAALIVTQSKRIVELEGALRDCLEKGSRWHPCDPVVVQARALLGEK